MPVYVTGVASDALGTSHNTPCCPSPTVATLQYRPVSTDMMMVCSPGAIAVAVVLPLAGCSKNCCEVSFWLQGESV